MPSQILHDQAKKYARKHPMLQPGYTVRVHERIKEGEKERVQIFEGLVIGMHRGQTPADGTVTVRRIASGVGVERIFPVLSPAIERIEVKKVAKVRRAKLNFLRGRTGKAARMTERFTNAGEFAGEADEPLVPEAGKAEEVTEENIVEAPAEPESAATGQTDEAAAA